MKAITHADIGTKIGRVTEALGQLPIVNDFYRQMDLLQLEECMSKEQLLKLKIDKRKDIENKQSIFLSQIILAWCWAGIFARSTFRRFLNWYFIS